MPRHKIARKVPSYFPLPVVLSEKFYQKFALAHIHTQAYQVCMSAIKLSQFTLREKFQIMQSIWEELRTPVEHFEVPQSHREILDERRRRVDSGESTLLDWDQVKHTIGKR